MVAGAVGSNCLCQGQVGGLVDYAKAISWTIATHPRNRGATALQRGRRVRRREADARFGRAVRIRRVQHQRMVQTHLAGFHHDVVMKAGEMSLHHPLMLHASNPNCSSEARIGFSATYSTPALQSSRTAVAWVRGDGPRDRLRIIDKPPDLTLAEAVAAYRAGNHQVLFAK